MPALLGRRSRRRAQLVPPLRGCADRPRAVARHVVADGTPRRKGRMAGGPAWRGPRLHRRRWGRSDRVRRASLVPPERAEGDISRRPEGAYMGSNAKNKTTMAKLNRESAGRERRMLKQAKKDARKQSAARERTEVSETAPGDAI